MVATPLSITPIEPPLSLDDFLRNPPENSEWIDGQLIDKRTMTLRHSTIQSQIATYWNNHATATNQGGRALTEAPCRTQNQGRRPDVAYLPQALYQQYGQVASLPQSFPLIAEIASPDDRAEDLFAKADEYLDSGCDEVWIVFPEARFILVKARTKQGNIGQWQALGLGQTIATQHGLPGFQCQVDDLIN
jgi:Uma2 family endonuclease